MKCPACVEAGTPSRLDFHRRPPHPAPVERFYDEAGILHVHDHSGYCDYYTCSNGHGYMREHLSRCPQKACAWNKRPEVIEGERPLGADAS
jgi:hypothetical protein